MGNEKHEKPTASIVTEGLIGRDRTAKLLEMTLKHSGFAVSILGITQALQYIEEHSPEELWNATYVDDSPGGEKVGEAIMTKRASPEKPRVVHVTVDPMEPVTWADETYLLFNGITGLMKTAKSMVVKDLGTST